MIDLYRAASAQEAISIDDSLAQYLGFAPIDLACLHIHPANELKAPNTGDLLLLAFEEEQMQFIRASLLAQNGVMCTETALAESFRFTKLYKHQANSSSRRGKQQQMVCHDCRGCTDMWLL